MGTIILGDGYIAYKIKSYFNFPIVKNRINFYEDVECVIEEFKPECIINCIGFTGYQNVDDCENDINKTLQSNVMVPLLLAEACMKYKIKLIHISSGCIYNYDHDMMAPLSETAFPTFFDLAYSRSKFYAEEALCPLTIEKDILITRIRIPLDNESSPRNVLTKLLYFKEIIDIPNSVTYLPDFMKALDHLMVIDARGVYNTVNDGGLRYPELLDFYNKYVENPHEYKVIYTLPMPRSNLLLSTKKLSDSGFNVRHIKDVFKECVTTYIKNSGYEVDYGRS